jgi:pectinacetylesterase
MRKKGPAASDSTTTLAQARIDSLTEWKIMKRVGFIVGGGLIAGGLYLNFLATALFVASVLILGILYVYFIFFGRPSEATTLDQVRDHKWHTVTLGGNTRSSDGSEYVLYVRRGESKNLLIQFSGGGACWDGKTAARPITPASVLSGYTRELKAFYFKSLTRLFPAGLAGITKRRDSENAFREWNVVFIPYSTGDIHVGNTTNTYTYKGKSFEVHHNGRNNCLASLEWVYANFKGVEKVLVAGESSGAWASAFYAPQIADQYSDRKLYCLSDCVGLASNRWSEIVDTVWKADSAKALGFEIGTDIFEDSLLRRLDSKQRNIKYLHSNTLYDDTLTRFGAAFNDSPIDTTEFIDDWSANTKKSMQRLSEAGLDYNYFLTDWGLNTKRHTTQHTLTTNEFYHKCTADGVSFSEWLRRNVIDDESVSLGSRLLA